MEIAGDLTRLTTEEGMRKQRIVGISFEHMHMGDLLREAHEPPNAEIVGVCDPRAGANGRRDTKLRHP